MELDHPVHVDLCLKALHQHAARQYAPLMMKLLTIRVAKVRLNQ